MEKEECLVLIEGGSAQIEEKKSRFIATFCAVSTQQEAEAFIEEMRKKYWDARHNCTAFVLGERGEITRSSDDGEPSGTAGKPMLEVLRGACLTNAAVVVTRYFGGTLLGTGGLIRAYTQAVQEGLKNCRLGKRINGVELLLRTDYDAVGKILYLLGQKGITPKESSYAADVTLTLLIPENEQASLRKEVMDATAGKVSIEEKNRLYYIEAIQA